MSNSNEGATARDPVAKLDAGIRPHDGARFSIALRGYDRIEVDECLARIAGNLSALTAPGSRRPQPPTPSSEQRNTTVPLAARHDGRREGSGQPSSEDGFGARLEKIMVLARQEAAEIRAGATAEARELVEQARASPRSPGSTAKTGSSGYRTWRSTAIVCCSWRSARAPLCTTSTDAQA
jgi:DivIVA domain-containing protein